MRPKNPAADILDVLRNQQAEDDFQAQLLQFARLRGWLCYHTHNSNRSPKGFPDLCMVRPPRLVFAELKKVGEQPTPQQAFWLAELRRCPGPEVFLWTPGCWNEIEKTLM